MQDKVNVVHYITPGCMSILSLSSELTERTAYRKTGPAETLQENRLFFLNCDFDRDGVWAGTRDLLLCCISEMQEEPDALIRHTSELNHILPEVVLHTPNKANTLTDSSIEEERVRSYSAERAFRIPHGIIDLIREWKTLHDNERVWVFCCHRYESSSSINQH